MGKLMVPYKNRGWDSNIIAYEIGDNHIIIKFASWSWTLYTYTYSSAWATHIENMKKFAIEWKWLNSYISSEKPKYSSKK